MKKIAVYIMRLGLEIIYLFMKLFPAKENKVLFLSRQSDRITVIFAVAGIVCIIICLVLAWKLTIKTGKKVLESILVPLREVEAVAQEL